MEARTLGLIGQHVQCVSLVVVSLLYVGCVSSDSGTADLCTNIRCSNHGTCLMANGSPTCQCQTGYHVSGGVNCVKDTTTSCNGVTCGGFGQCQVQNGSASCVCNTGYHADGLNCVRDANACANKNCNNHGTCANGNCDCYTGFDPQFDCAQCLPGYTGYPTCKASSCDGITCSGHGTCANGVCTCNKGFDAAYGCSRCSAGYTNYPYCSADQCASVNCNGHGTCQSGQCYCYTGYDQSNCSSCAAGYTGYPNCKADDCTGVTCNGHGTCQGGTCSCYVGYDPVYGCGKCIAGYGGYPNCTQCVCSSGQQKCSGTTSLTECLDGCTWTTKTCTQICQIAGSPSSQGCAYRASGGKDICWCYSGTARWLVWKVGDLYNDGVSPQAALYSGSTTWGPVSVAYNNPYTFEIQCTSGSTIKLGAWQSGRSWGCGENCANATSDPNCIATCGSQLTKETGLNVQ